MNIKDILVVMGLALLTSFAIDRLILRRCNIDTAEQALSGQAFNAPQSKQVIKPLNREIDFIDTKRATKEVITEIETNWASLTFSSDGASLERLAFKHELGGKPDIITTIFPKVEREEKAFLVALDEKTPYYFTLADKKETAESVELTYESSFGDGMMRKTYTILKDLHKIDLTITLEPRAGIERDVQARVFFPSPIMPAIKKDKISAIIGNIKGTIETIVSTSLDLQRGWWSPSLFGTENKYFVHALIADDASFVQRAYYTTTPDEQIISILEGPEVQQKGSWTVSFYCGPKDTLAMAPVDVRLEQTLAYSGWLAPLSKLLLKLLNYLYDYTRNYGLAILLLTLVIRLLLLPFALKGERGMKKTTDMQRKLKYLEQKHKNDPERLMREKAELIKKQGLPSIGGCLPMLVQIPIFFALSRVLSGSIELYEAPFLWIPDLSASDPYYILPALILVAMLLQAFTSDPKQRYMMIAMAFVFGAFASNFASGLVLYISASTIIGVLQTTIQKQFKAA